MVDELVSLSAPALPKIKFWELFDMFRVPVPLSVTPDTPTISSVALPPEFKVIVPLLVMLPSAVRASLFTIVRASPEPLSVSVPKLPATFMFTFAVAVPMVTALALLGTPALQFPEVPQLLSPAVPVQESAVSGGGAVRVALRDAAMLATGCGLNRDCCESLRFAPGPACAAARPFRLVRAVSRQRTVIHRVTTGEDAGRMEVSTRTDSVGTSATLIVFLLALRARTQCSAKPYEPRTGS